MRGIGSVLSALKQTVGEFFEDDALTQAAAVAFYTALSFAPLVLLLVTIGGMLGQDNQDALVEQFRGAMGNSAGDSVQEILDHAEETQQQNGVWWRWAIGLVVLLFSASGVFAQLQYALNTIWDVKPKPGESGAMAWIRKRSLSIGMIFAILFVLLVSLVVSTVVEMLIPGNFPYASRIGQVIVSLIVFTLLFAAIYKFLPDVRIDWEDVWLGAGITAVLFAIGKEGIGLYLRYAAPGSAYGAAGSLIVLLTWVYYSGLILFFGAELTQVVTRRRGKPIQPDEHAVMEDDAAGAGRGAAVAGGKAEEGEGRSPLAGGDPLALARAYDEGRLDRRELVSGLLEAVAARGVDEVIEGLDRRYVKMLRTDPLVRHPPRRAEAVAVHLERASVEGLDEESLRRRRDHARRRAYRALWQTHRRFYRG